MLMTEQSQRATTVARRPMKAEGETAGPTLRSPLTSGITIFVGFLHDFAAGIWAACAFAIWWLERPTPASAGREALAALQREFFFIALACLAVVLLAGVGRTFTYVSGVYGEHAEARRRRMLAVKHVVLLAVFSAGTLWQYAMVFGW